MARIITLAPIILSLMAPARAAELDELLK